MALTEKQIKNAKPREKVYKMYDGHGLLLRVKPNGAKIWEYKYKIHAAGRQIEKALALGVYGDVSLKEARYKSFEARKLRAANKDPVELKKTQKRLAKFNSENTFEGIAREWHKNQAPKWTAQYAMKLWRRLELHIFPNLGRKAIADVTALDLLDSLRNTESRDKVDTSHRALQACRSIFQYAVLTQKIRYNPANDLKGVLKAHRKIGLPSIGPNQLPAFLEKLDEVKTTTMNRLAMKILMLTFVRQGELRRAKWEDFDFKGKQWRVRPETTKMRELHIVPLAEQTILHLEQLRLISGESEYLLPSQNRQKNPIMCENTINNVIHDMGYKGQMVGHGVRSMASTILNENGFRPDVIERQLAHMPRDKVRAAYNRAQYLVERCEMMQWWADYLDRAKSGSSATQLNIK